MHISLVWYVMLGISEGEHVCYLDVSVIWIWIALKVTSKKAIWLFKEATIFYLVKSAMNLKMRNSSKRGWGSYLLKVMLFKYIYFLFLSMSLLNKHPIYLLFPIQVRSACNITWTTERAVHQIFLFNIASKNAQKLP